jgi:hypothetical protein
MGPQGASGSPGQDGEPGTDGEPGGRGMYFIWYYGRGIVNVI